MNVASFDRIGPAEPSTPLVVSVPHGGRDYPDALRAALRVPLVDLLPLEDRHIDTLARAALGEHLVFIARRPRAWIDLNRSEQERDSRIDDGARAFATPFQSAKVRGGLGLVPRRASGSGDIWAGRFTADDIAARIAIDHRPYHLALDEALRVARARFGIAILLDLHSMPSLAGPDSARIVIGDRFGRSAGARFVARVEAIVRANGLRAALNTPYAGGHILDRHGGPRRSVHAVQLEIDRSLYLDAGRVEPGPGFARTCAIVRSIADTLAEEAVPIAVAAE